MGKKNKIIISLITIFLLGLFIYLFFDITGVTNIEELQDLVSGFGAWSWVVFILLQIVVTSILSFIPGTSLSFLTVGVIMFGPLNGFIIGVISVFASSSLMFFLGKVLGQKFVVWIVGKEKFEELQNNVTTKSKILIPVMFTFPFFPDDALCLMAGLTKMKFSYFATIVLIFRSIGIATVSFFSGGFIDYASISLVEWLLIVNVLIFDGFIIWKYTGKLEQVIKKRSERKTKRKSKGVVVKDPSLIKELLTEKTYIIVRDEKEIKEIEEKIKD